MTNGWRAFARRFDARPDRERLLVGAAALLLAVFLLQILLVGPQLARRDAAVRQADQRQNELRQTDGQLAILRNQRQDPDAALRVRLDDLRRRIAETDGKLRSLELSLVPPQRVPVLLQELLDRRRALKLVALRTLPVAPLLERAVPKVAADGKAAGTAPRPVAGGEPNLYKHGVELVVQGTYPDLAGYLAELEAIGARLYFSRVSLRAGDYPISTLTLRLFTLSLDKTWLAV